MIMTITIMTKVTIMTTNNNNNNNKKLVAKKTTNKNNSSELLKITINDHISCYHANSYYHVISWCVNLSADWVA